MIPQVPAILLSFVNTKLRDEFSSLEELCAALDADQASLVKTLVAIGYTYDPAQNQFT